MGTNYTRAFTPGIDKEMFPGLSQVRTSVLAIGEPPSNLGPLRVSSMPRVVQEPGEVYDWNRDSDWWRL